VRTRLSASSSSISYFVRKLFDVLRRARYSKKNKPFTIERYKPRRDKRSLAVSVLIASEKLIALSFERPTEYRLKSCLRFESINGRRPIR
jgi:hypothetical protein